MSGGKKASNEDFDFISDDESVKKGVARIQKESKGKKLRLKSKKGSENEVIVTPSIPSSRKSVYSETIDIKPSIENPIEKKSILSDILNKENISAGLSVTPKMMTKRQLPKSPVNGLLSTQPRPRVTEPISSSEDIINSRMQFLKDTKLPYEHEVERMSISPNVSCIPYSLNDIMPMGLYLPLSQMENLPDDLVPLAKSGTGPTHWKERKLSAHYLVGSFVDSALNGIVHARGPQVNFDLLRKSLLKEPYLSGCNIKDTAGNNLIAAALMNPHVSPDTMKEILAILADYGSRPGALNIGDCGPSRQTLWHCGVLRELRFHDFQIEWISLFDSVLPSVENASSLIDGLAQNSKQQYSNRRSTRLKVGQEQELTVTPTSAKASEVNALTEDEFGRLPITYVRLRADPTSVASSVLMRESRDKLNKWLLPYGLRKTKLHLAVESGNEFQLHLAIQQAQEGQFSADAKDADGFTAFHIAVRTRYQRAQIALLSSGLPINVNSPTYCGRNALITAIAVRDTRAIAILSRIASMSAESLSDIRESMPTSCTLQPQSGRAPVLDFNGPLKVINSGVGAFSPPDQIFPLLAAVETGDVFLVRSLLQAGSNVNITDEHGEGALFRAIERDSPELVALIAKYGADPHITDIHGNGCSDLVTERGLKSGDDFIKKFFNMKSN